jgi:flagellar protein FliS
MALANSYSQQSLANDRSPALSKATLKSRTGGASLQYQRAQVETASPTRLIIMLYEGAIRFCQLALDAMVKQDLPVQHENLLKAQRIVAELLSSLNREKGGEVAENLARLYTHMLEQLVVANLHDEPEAVKTVQSMLRDLRASWVEVERLTGKGESEETGNRVQGTEGGDSSLIPRPVTPNMPRLGRLNA